jgi:ribonuclease BN (tRNA processing enzyme)
MIDRRSLLRGAVALGAAGVVRAALPQQGTKVVLLGTKGGPSPSLQAGEPANLVVVDDVPYLIDCGYGVILKMLRAGYSCVQLPAVFVTHHHFDHNADLGNVVMTAWQLGLDRTMQIIAPTPVKQMMEGYMRFSEPDIGFRMREEGRKPLAPLLGITEVARGGAVYQDAHVKVSALLVDHWTVKPALAFRFETASRIIVFSGDTTYFPPLAEFSRGADMLVHEALYMPAVEQGLGSRGAPNMHEHIVRSHTTTEDIGRIAKAANVKTVVLSHLVPYKPDISDTMWSDGVRKHFGGEVIVGHDGMIL